MTGPSTRPRFWVLLLLWVDSGLVPEIAARGFGPKLSPEAVARLATEARLAPGGLSHKLRALERMLGQLVGGEKGISNCSSHDSVWQFEQVLTFFPFLVPARMLNS